MTGILPLIKGFSVENQEPVVGLLVILNEQPYIELLDGEYAGSIVKIQDGKYGLFTGWMADNAEMLFEGDLVAIIEKKGAEPPLPDMTIAEGIYEVMRIGFRFLLIPVAKAREYVEFVNRVISDNQIEEAPPEIIKMFEGIRDVENIISQSCYSLSSLGSKYEPISKLLQ